MLCRFKTKWNNKCDLLYNFYIKNKEREIVQKIINSRILQNSLYYSRVYFPKIYCFIASCDNMNSPIIKIRKKEYPFNYNKRSEIVAGIATFNSIRGKSFLKSYFLISLFICRENLNILNYKFNIIDNKNTMNDIKKK